MCLAAPADAQVDAPAQARTSIDCRNLPLRTALRTLVQNAGLRHNVRYEVPDLLVSLKLRDVPFEDALKVLLRQASFSGKQYRLFQSTDAYEVRSGRDLVQDEEMDWPAVLPPGEPSANLLRKEQSTVKDLLLREALAQVFTAAGAPYVVDENIPNIMLSVPNAPDATLWGSLLRIVDEARRSVPRLYVGQVGEIYVIAVPPPPREVTIESPSVRDTPFGNQRKVSIRLVNVPLRAAIEAVLAGSGRYYSVNPDVPDIPITIELRDVTPVAALFQVLRQAKRRIPGLSGSTS